MNQRLIILLLLAVSLGHRCSAIDVGLKFSQLRPRGDIGETYDRGISYELLLAADHWDDKWRATIGLGYTKLNPLLDTFFIYGVKGEKTILPGYNTYEALPMKYLYIEEHFRLFKIKNFSFYAGAGLMLGHTTVKQSYAIEEMIISKDGSIDYMIVGLRGGLQAAYRVAKRFIVTADVRHNALVDQEWTFSFTNRTIGLGILYRFNTKNDEDNE